MRGLFVFACSVLMTLSPGLAFTSSINFAHPQEDETYWLGKQQGATAKCSIVSSPAVTGKSQECDGTSVQQSLRFAVHTPTGITKGPTEYSDLACCFDVRATLAIWNNGILALESDSGALLAYLQWNAGTGGGYRVTNNPGASAYSSCCGGQTASNAWQRVCILWENDTTDKVYLWDDKNPATETADLDVTITSTGYNDNFGQIRWYQNKYLTLTGKQYTDNVLCSSDTADWDALYKGVVKPIVADGDQYSYNSGTALIQDNDGSCNSICDNTVNDYWKCVDGVSCTEPEDEAHSWHLSEIADQTYSTYAGTSGLAGATIYGVGLYGYLQGEGGTGSLTQWGVASNCDSAGYSDMKNSATIVEENNVWNTYFYFNDLDEDSNAWDAEGLDCLNAGIAKITNSTNNVEVDVMSLVYVYDPDTAGGGSQPIFMSSLVDWLVELWGEGEGVN